MLRVFKNRRLQYISANAVLKEAVTGEYYGKVSYIIYKDENAEDFKIRLNTYYKRASGNTYELLNSYDCGLCQDLNEYEKLSEEEIENRAYNCYMTGAR